MELVEIIAVVTDKNSTIEVVKDGFKTKQDAEKYIKDNKLSDDYFVAVLDASKN